MNGAGTLSLSDLSLCESISKWWELGHVHNIIFLVLVKKYHNPLKGICKGKAYKKIVGLQMQSQYMAPLSLVVHAKLLVG